MSAPPAGPVVWLIALKGDFATTTRLEWILGVKAQTWYFARQNAAAALGAEPEALVVTQQAYAWHPPVEEQCISDS